MQNMTQGPRHVVIGGGSGFVGEERSSILLRGQLVRPKRTLQSGYRFRFPTIESALDDLVHITI